MSGNRRVDRIVKALTPKQAILALIAEATRFDSFEDSARLLIKEDQFTRYCSLVIDGIRESLKEEPKRAVDDAIVKGIREMVFLYGLRQSLETYLLQQEIERVLTAQLLATHLERMIEALLERDKTREALLNLLGIYPLPADDAAAVTALHRNRQWMFYELQTRPMGVFGGSVGIGMFEGNPADLTPLVKWVTAHFVEQGRPTIPLEAYLHRIAHTRNRPALRFELSEAEILNLFGSKDAYRNFVSGQDFSFGLADVRDQEFQSNLRSVLRALLKLVASGSVEAATEVVFPSVPLPALRCATMIGGDWIDRHVVELAEFGAMLADHGFKTASDGGDPHPLASPLVCAPEECAIDVAQIRNLAAAHISTFAGRSTSIDGRPYLSVADYQGWSQRRLKGELKCVHGFSINSFNDWADRNKSGGAELAGIRVESICEPRMSESNFAVYSDVEGALKAQQWRRETVDRFMDKNLRRKSWQSWASWPKALHAHAEKVLLARVCIDFLQDKYFAGQRILLKSSMKEIETGVEMLASLAKQYDAASPKAFVDAEAAALPPSCISDLVAIKKSIDPKEKANPLITSAKAFTLRSMGLEEEALKRDEENLKGTGVLDENC
jgi:hypothetical protein